MPWCQPWRRVPTSRRDRPWPRNDCHPP
jgi:hypothetical protein